MNKNLRPVIFIAISAAIALFAVWWVTTPVSGKYCDSEHKCYTLDFDRLPKDASDVPFVHRFVLDDLLNKKEVRVQTRWTVFVGGYAYDREAR